MFASLLEKSLLITLLTTLAALPSSAQTSDDLFNPQTLQSLHLRINSTDLSLLHTRDLDNTFYPVQIEWQGIPVRFAAIRPGIVLDEVMEIK